MAAVSPTKVSERRGWERDTLAHFLQVIEAEFAAVCVSVREQENPEQALQFWTLHNLAKFIAKQLKEEAEQSRPIIYCTTLSSQIPRSGDGTLSYMTIADVMCEGNDIPDDSPNAISDLHPGLEISDSVASAMLSTMVRKDPLACMDVVTSASQVVLLRAWFHKLFQNISKTEPSSGYFDTVGGDFWNSLMETKLHGCCQLKKLFLTKNQIVNTKNNFVSKAGLSKVPATGCQPKKARQYKALVQKFVPSEDSPHDPERHIITKDQIEAMRRWSSHPTRPKTDVAFNLFAENPTIVRRIDRHLKLDADGTVGSNFVHACTNVIETGEFTRRFWEHLIQVRAELNERMLAFHSASLENIDSRMALTGLLHFSAKHMYDKREGENFIKNFKVHVPEDAKAEFQECITALRSAQGSATTNRSMDSNTKPQPIRAQAFSTNGGSPFFDRIQRRRPPSPDPSIICIKSSDDDEVWVD